ncbi:MAG: hypothetical protein RR406_02585 [Bacilli bacterium]
MEKKKLYIILGSITGAIVVVILGVVIFGVMANSKLSYNEVETKMIKATEKYYLSNKNLLPKIEGEEVSLDVSTLVAGKYMKSLSDLLDKNTSCQGKVTVKKNGERYFYNPSLTCGDKYSTKTLREVIIGKTDLTSDGSGIYDLNGEKVFRGENPNNYVSFAKGIWRIVKVDKKGNIELISYNNDISKSSVLWDDRYNAEKDSTVGINDYPKSRIRETLVNYYNNEKFFTELDKARMIANNFCIGKRSKTDTSKDGSAECGQVMELEPIGLLPVYDVLNASLDLNCKATKDSSCQNYNYLVKQGDKITNSNYWLGTATAEDTYNVYTSYVGTVAEKRAGSTASLRPVIYLNSNVLFSKGLGTLDNPYIIK